MKFNGTELTEETIIATRQWYADNATECISQARLYIETDGAQGFRVNDIDRYTKWNEKCAADSLAGLSDNNFAFMQRAYFIQTGECVPLFSK